jgi:menaquinone-dependent protoporphyrinogen IX oxidase
MRSLVVYDPASESSEVVARSIAEGLRERGAVHVAAVEEISPSDVEEAHFVVVGGPAELMDVSLSMRRLTHAEFARAWSRRPVAVFETEVAEKETAASSAARLAARLLARGALVAAPPHSFRHGAEGDRLGEGEVVRAMIWGRALHLAERVPASLAV